MRNTILMMMLSLIFINLIININYIFAIKNDSIPSINKGSSSSDGTSKDSNQKNNQNIQCNINADCENQSQQQQTHQNTQCNTNSKCITYSTSNIVICKERSVCLVQYEGPFQLANPY